MAEFIYKVVGGHFRPPALILTGSLPIGTPLHLQAEPSNQYDANAIAVYLVSAEIPTSAIDELEERLPSVGYSFEDILDRYWWHIGYIPREFAAQLRQSGTIDPISVYKGEFLTDFRGKPMIKFDPKDIELGQSDLADITEEETSNKPVDYL